MAILIGRLDRNNVSKSIKAGDSLIGRNVLVVDDSPTQRRKLRELYESLGFVCVGEASNGLECIEMVERLKPHLVSLDILMPTMHGVETLGYLREAQCKSIIILVSALGNIESIAEVRARGHAPDAVFSKKDTRDMFMTVLTEIFDAEQHRWESAESISLSAQHG